MGNRGKLSGKTALITGAGGGIGRGLALALASDGARVVIAARRLSTGEQTAQIIRGEGGEACAVQCDVTHADQIRGAVDFAIENYQRLDIVIHNAVAAHNSDPLRVEDVTDELWDAQSAVTWDGAYHLARASQEHLRRSRQGRFLLLGSAYGLHGASLNPIYASLKGGYRGFVKALAREWAQFNITVNAIQPVAATELSDAYFQENPALRAEFLSNFPMGRMGDPRTDIGLAVAAICSGDFGFVTAQTIQIDGGLYTAI